MSIKELVIPAAGLGTRFLPYTKSISKEMLPLINKPAIQNIIEEAINCDISKFIIINSKDKNCIQNYFSNSQELEIILKEKNKKELLHDIEKIIQTCNFNYILQERPLGLGHAILQAKNQIASDFFAVSLPDDIIFSEKPAILQLIEISNKYNCSVIAIQEVPKESVSSYGIISIKEKYLKDIFELSDIIEKPKIKSAPSNLSNRKIHSFQGNI